tara:strand:- start:3620 stop:3943 length:324 start_codon:yes stop_codon:yes gene_type:complete
MAILSSILAAIKAIPAVAKGVASAVGAAGAAGGAGAAGAGAAAAGAAAAKPTLSAVLKNIGMDSAKGIATNQLIQRGNEYLSPTPPPPMQTGRQRNLRQLLDQWGMK